LTYEMAKVNKRLWIRDTETGDLVYTPPDFIRQHLISRRVMILLVDDLTRPGAVFIDLIMRFERSLRNDL
jgi:hypothetical protein